MPELRHLRGHAAAGGNPENCCNRTMTSCFRRTHAVLTPQEIDELMEIMRSFKKEGKYLFTPKLAEISVADAAPCCARQVLGRWKWRTPRWRNVPPDGGRDVSWLPQSRKAPGQDRLRWRHDCSLPVHTTTPEKCQPGGTSGEVVCLAVSKATASGLSTPSRLEKMSAGKSPQRYGYLRLHSPAQQAGHVPHPRIAISHGMI